MIGSSTDRTERGVVLLLLGQDVAELMVHGVEEPVVHVDGLSLMALVGVIGIDTGVVNV